MIIFDPYFWGIIGLMGLMGLATSITTGALARRRWLAPVLLLVPAAAQTVLVMPFVAQPRLAEAAWFLPAGMLLCIMGGVMASSGTLPLQWAADPRARVELKVLGAYHIVRHPLYLGDILYAAGIALIFRSIPGLLFLPVWWLAFLLLSVIEESILTDIIGTTYQTYTERVKGRLLPRLSLMLKESRIRVYPFRNLSLKGGGVRGIAYAGVLEVLEEEGILDQIQRVSGTSAGAITAMITAFRLPVPRVIDIFNTLTFSHVPQARVKEVRRPVIADELVCSQRLLSDFGWFSSQYFYDWLQEVIAGQCEGNGRATFADFRARGFRDLYIVASNITRQRAEVFSAETHPDVAVADAVRMSMSIPLYFEALRFDGKSFGSGDLYVDGGVFDNFPIKYFDDQRFAHDSNWFVSGVNWETLGCYLYTPDGCEGEQKEIGNVFQFMTELMESYVVEYREGFFRRDLAEQMRTITISDQCVRATQFDITVDSPEYEMLIESGRAATREFLKNYRPIP